jgi:hypothetical protein
MPSPPDRRWDAACNKPKVVDTAARFLHMRGYSRVNFAEVDEAVRLELDQTDLDPFAGDVPKLADIFSSKQEIFTTFLNGVLGEAVDHSFNTLSRQLKQARPGQAVDAIQVVVGGIDRVLTTFQSFRFLIAGAVADGFTARLIDPFLFAESRRAAHIFFAGLLGFWELDGNPEFEDLDKDTEWREQVYDPSRADAVQVVRDQLDMPLGQEALVEGLFLVYGAATVWWLMNRTRSPAEATQVVADLTFLVAEALRKRGSGQDDSFLRRVLRIEKHVRNIQLSDPLRRIIRRSQLENLGQRLLSVAYGEVPRRILLANELS